MSEDSDHRALAARFAALGARGQDLDDDTIAEVTGVLDHHADPRVQAAALGALVRSKPAHARDLWIRAAASGAASVRRRAAELAPQLTSPESRSLTTLIADTEPLVAETACWACGEIAWPDNVRPEIVTALIAAAGADDALVREAAVAALGAIGDSAGLDTILERCHDQPTVRRRAVLALAPFDDPRVETALRCALEDSDWQTRQAAEDLL